MNFYYNVKIINSTHENLFIQLLLFISSLAIGQQEIKIDNAKNHVGDSVKICTKIYGGKFLGNIKGTPTFLNSGGYYPNAPLTIVIWADARKEFDNPPEEIYKGKEVCITGKIQLYKDKPQIVITSKSQIVEQIIIPLIPLLHQGRFHFASYNTFPLWHVHAITPIAL